MKVLSCPSTHTTGFNQPAERKKKKKDKDGAGAMAAQQRTWLWFPALTQQLTTIRNCSSRGSNILWMQALTYDTILKREREKGGREDRHRQTENMNLMKS